MKRRAEVSSEVPIIVTTVDSKYTLPLAVMLKSLELNLSSDQEVIVHVLHSNLHKTIKDELQNCIDSKLVHIYWNNISSALFDGLKVDLHISVETYFRLATEKLFPQYSKVIYLDADLLILKSISELWKFDLSNFHLLAAPQIYRKSGLVSEERGLPSYKLLGIPPDTRTFNAGVMVLNLELWRKDDISNKVLEYLRRYKSYVLWWDQDGLNAVLYNKWKPLPLQWNVMTNHLRFISSKEDLLISEVEFEFLLLNPSIVHFAGECKPWLIHYEGRYKNLYLSYLNKLQSVEELSRFSAITSLNFNT